MAGYAPPPAEEYGDSDEDDFSFAPPGQTSYQYHNTSSNNIRSGGFNWDSPPNSELRGKSNWTVGGGPTSASGSSRSLPKSKIPVVSPTNSGLNIEDFRQALIRGSTESTQKCIDQGVDVNIKFRTGWTPLMYAAHHVNEPLLRLLLTSGASPTSHTDGSPLFSCCSTNITNREQDIEKCVRLLIEHGAGVNTKDKDLVTPLMYACKKGHLGAINVLLEHKAEVNVQEQRGFSPLCFACSSGNVACIKALVQADADINVRTLANQTPLKLASSLPNFNQISAYFTSLPGFQPDPYDDMGDWEAPTSSMSSTLLTNGTHNTAAQTADFGAQAAASSSNMDCNTSSSKTAVNGGTTMDKSSPAYTRFGDLEIFLHGLELSTLIPHFQNHNVTLDHLLNISDDELIKVGVHSVGHRKLILDSVHELHKKEWKPSSIPAYEKVKTGKQLNCAEVTAIVANVANHSAYITASLNYVTTQVGSNPSLLQVDKNGRGLHALRRFIHELQVNTENQTAAGTNLKAEIEKTLSGGAAETVDEITHNTTQKSGNRLVLYSSALISIGIISLGVYVISKRFPHIKIPFVSK